MGETTELHTACKSGKPEAIAKALPTGDLNAEDEKGNTPDKYARGNPAAARALMGVKLINNDGNSSYQGSPSSLPPRSFVSELQNDRPQGHPLPPLPLLGKKT